MNDQERTAELNRKDYIWNTAAGLINAAEAVVMSMIVTRVTGLSDAGILTIAFAFGNLMMSVGKFGVRNYQVTDVQNRFSFSLYVKTRLFTVFLMVAAVLGYLAYASVHLKYGGSKIGIIFAICMIYAVESLEDVVWGYYQRRNRMDMGAKMFCFRWFSIFAVFLFGLKASKNLMITLFCCLPVSVFVFVLLLKLSYARICAEDDKIIRLAIRKEDIWEMKELLIKVFPLFGISFLSFYVNNAPKYAIDACLPDEVQAYYGFVAMPVFVIGLLNNFVYQPTLVPMAVEWEQGQDVKFIHRVFRQMGVIGAISILCLAGAYAVGIPVLSWLYHADLSAYKRELMILLAAGGFLAVSGYLSVVLTIMRWQKALLWPYCLAAGTAVISLKRIVSCYGTTGAAVAYLCLMILLCFLYGVILAGRLKERERLRGDQR